MKVALGSRLIQTLLTNFTKHNSQMQEEKIRGVTGENILIFKELLYQIFDLSENEKEAYFKRNNLFKEI